MTFTFAGGSPGSYAISTLHDTNLNFHMDFNTLGIAAEHFDISGTNNQMGLLFLRIARPPN